MMVDLAFLVGHVQEGSMEIMGILEIPWMPDLPVYMCGGAWFRAAGCAGRGLFLLWMVAWAPLGGRWRDCVSSGRCWMEARAELCLLWLGPGDPETWSDKAGGPFP